jgi:hypothetical protein
VDTKRYGRLKTELNNTHVAGQNKYPKTVESAVTMLAHYMNNKGVHMTDVDKGQTDRKSFMQKHKNVMCYKCGKKGHYAKMTMHQLDQVPATTAGLTAFEGVASMMVSHYSKRAD